MSGKPRLTAKQKKEIQKTLCELLEKSPIIESACQKVGISRMTLSRWRKDDARFSRQLEDALHHARASVNDLAESKMIQGIQEGNASLIRFWLSNNCDRYKAKPDERPQIHFHTDPHDSDHWAAMIRALPEGLRKFYEDHDSNR